MKQIDGLIQKGSVLIGAVLIMITLASVARAEPVIRMIGGNFRPYFFYNEEGQLDGYTVGLLDRIVSNAGMTWKGEVVPPRRMVHMLQTGDADIALLGKNPAFQKDENILHGKQEISRLALNIYHRADTPFIKELPELRQKKVLAIQTYGYGGLRAWLEQPENGVELINVERFQQAIQMLESGRADYLILYDVNFAEGVEKIHRPAQDIVFSAYSRIPIYFMASRKGAHDADALLARLEESYRNLVATGGIPEPDFLRDQIVSPGAD